MNCFHYNFYCSFGLHFIDRAELAVGTGGIVLESVNFAIPVSLCITANCRGNYDCTVVDSTRNEYWTALKSAIKKIGKKNFCYACSERADYTFVCVCGFCGCLNLFLAFTQQSAEFSTRTHTPIQWDAQYKSSMSIKTCSTLHVYCMLYCASEHNSEMVEKSFSVRRSAFISNSHGRHSHFERKQKRKTPNDLNGGAVIVFNRRGKYSDLIRCKRKTDQKSLAVELFDCCTKRIIRQSWIGLHYFYFLFLFRVAFTVHMLKSNTKFWYCLVSIELDLCH